MWRERESAWVATSSSRAARSRPPASPPHSASQAAAAPLAAATLNARPRGVTNNLFSSRRALHPPAGQPWSPGKGKDGLVNPCSDIILVNFSLDIHLLTWIPVMFSCISAMFIFPWISIIFIWIWANRSPPSHSSSSTTTTTMSSVSQTLESMDAAVEQDTPPTVTLQRKGRTRAHSMPRGQVAFTFSYRSLALSVHCTA